MAGVRLMDRRSGPTPPLSCMTLQAYLIVIGAAICSGRESLCLPYAGFFHVFVGSFTKFNFKAEAFYIPNNNKNVIQAFIFRA